MAVSIALLMLASSFAILKRITNRNLAFPTRRKTQKGIPTATLAIVQGEAFAPTANDIVQLVSSEYGVTFDVALSWCRNAFSNGVIA